jgi:hypothetical protein
MELSEDARLYTARDQDLGKIDRIIIDPVADKVTHLAVRNGIILSEPAGRHTSSWPTASQHPRAPYRSLPSGKFETAV